MATKYILALLGMAFLVFGFVRVARAGGQRHPQSRTWLLIGAVFGIVSAWLFFQSNP